MRNKRKSKYPPYDQAKAAAIDLNLASANKYREWIKDKKIEYLPAYPERVYKEWVSWNDYLGNQNVFGGDVQVVRPYWDAIRWAQEFCTIHSLDRIEDWSNYWKEHKDELPDDIPLNPDAKYKEEWDSWKTWLGTDIRGRLIAAKENTALLCICTKDSLKVAGNKFTIIQAEKGESELRSRLNKDKELKVVRCYRIENDYKEQMMNLINQYGRNEGDGWFIPLINSLLFELDMILMPFSGMRVG